MVVWAAAAPIALWALVRALGMESGGLPATAMFFTPFVAFGAVLVAGVAVALRNWPAAVVAGITAAYLAATVLPRAVGSEAVPVAGRETFTVLSANVYLGTADPDALIELVDRYNPDLLSVQELTPSFVRKLEQARLGKRLPHAVLMPQPGGRGGGLYARHPLAPLAIEQLLFRMPRARIVLPGGQPLRLVAVHPQPPNMSVDAWRDGLEILPEPGTGAPWVLAGDFNATFDQAEFRDLVDTGYRDAGNATGEGLEPTWPGPARLPFGLMTIDHVLADRRLQVAEYGVNDLAGSDHRAVHATLVLP